MGLLTFDATYVRVASEFPGTVADWVVIDNFTLSTDATHTRTGAGTLLANAGKVPWTVCIECTFWMAPASTQARQTMC